MGSAMEERPAAHRNEDEAVCRAISAAGNLLASVYETKLDNEPFGDHGEMVDEALSVCRTLVPTHPWIVDKLLDQVDWVAGDSADGLLSEEQKSEEHLLRVESQCYRRFYRYEEARQGRARHNAMVLSTVTRIVGPSAMRLSGDAKRVAEAVRRGADITEAQAEALARALNGLPSDRGMEVTVGHDQYAWDRNGLCLVPCAVEYGPDAEDHERAELRGWDAPHPITWSEIESAHAALAELE